jgi:hypothetical protein
VKTWLTAAIGATKKDLSAEAAAVSPRARSSTISTKAASPTEQREEPLMETRQPEASELSSVPALGAGSSAAVIGQLMQPHSTTQVALIVCALMFIYTMYRVCAAMDQMQELTRETLIQQRQQKELLQQLLDRL